MHSKYIFYFHDNKLQYNKKGEIKTYSFSKDCLQYGKIIHIEKFIKELKSFFKKEKRISIFTPSILVVIPYNFYNTDKEILLMSFNSLGINKIEFKYEQEFYPNKKNTTILNIHETYLLETNILNQTIKNYFYPFNIFKNKDQLLEIIINKKSTNSYLLIGTNKEIPNYVDNIKQMKQTNIHYYNNFQTFILEKAIKNQSPKKNK